MIGANEIKVIGCRNITLNSIGETYKVTVAYKDMIWMFDVIGSREKAVYIAKMKAALAFNRMEKEDKIWKSPKL
jgi:hypothetical protein